MATRRPRRRLWDRGVLAVARVGIFSAQTPTFSRVLARACVRACACASVFCICLLHTNIDLSRIPGRLSLWRGTRPRMVYHSSADPSFSLNWAPTRFGSGVLYFLLWTRSRFFFAGAGTTRRGGTRPRRGKVVDWPDGTGALPPAPLYPRQRRGRRTADQDDGHGDDRAARGCGASAGADRAGGTGLQPTVRVGNSVEVYSDAMERVPAVVLSKSGSKVTVSYSTVGLNVRSTSLREMGSGSGR